MTNQSGSGGSPAADSTAATAELVQAATSTLREIEATATFAHTVLLDRDSREPLGPTHFHLTAILALIRRLAAQGAERADDVATQLRSVDRVLPP